MYDAFQDNARNSCETCIVSWTLCLAEYADSADDKEVLIREASSGWMILKSTRNTDPTDRHWCIDGGNIQAYLLEVQANVTKKPFLNRYQRLSENKLLNRNSSSRMNERVNDFNNIKYKLGEVVTYH